MQKNGKSGRRKMNKYQESLDFIVKNSCPHRIVCRECKINKSCNNLVKCHIDRLQELIKKSERNFLKLEVYDKLNGKIHEVGSDTHDVLLVSDGVVEYYNLENGDGTGDGYEFVEKGLYDEFE